MNRAERRRAERAGLTTNPLAITWYSNAVWAPTGYGTQTKQAVGRLVADGHRVAIQTNYGLQATQMVYEGIPHYPMGIEPWSQDVVHGAYRDWSRQNPDLPPLMIALFDAWPLTAPTWDAIPRIGIWTMIDHLPAPPKVLSFLDKPNVTPLAASRFAHEQITRAGIDALYVPMAIDTEVYKPTPLYDNGAGPVPGRTLMGFGDDADDYFIVASVNANKAGGGIHRKAWGEHALAMSIFLANHDDARWYIHTEQHGNMGGVNFAPLLESLEIPRDRYRFVNQWAQHVGIPNEAMAALFTAADVLLAPTLGEGFGLTVAEAGACGLPAIVSDFTCQPELVSDDSYLVGGQPWWDSAQSAWWQVPNVEQIVEALEAAYARGRYRSQKQRDHIVANYDADLVYREHWRPALDALTNEPDLVLVDPKPAAVADNGKRTKPRLTIYIPAYRRPAELAALLGSLAPQLTPECEVIVSDDDPAGSAEPATAALADAAPCRVSYIRHGRNLGGNENLLRGLEAGGAPWLWMISDDDVVLPGAIADILAATHDDIDRLILLEEHAPTAAAGMLGTPAEIEAAQPGLLIAATLITANVVRKSALDVRLAREKVDTLYGCSWAQIGCSRVKVLAAPAFRVGTEHAGEFVAATKPDFDAVAAWTDLLLAFGVEPGTQSFGWNFVSAARAS